jgi:hypothetical protein
VINTIVIPALSRGSIPYEVWFGRKPPTDFLDYRESARRICIALGAIGGEIESNENGSSKSGEDSFFIEEGVE